MMQETGTEPPAAMVDVQHLRKQYDETLAVSDLSFSLGSGQILGLVGPNGAGKTTTLRSIAGIIAPTRGRIVIADFDLQTAPIEAKRRMAYVPDDPRLFEALTVWEHLEFIAQAYRVASFAPLAEQLLERLELRPKQDTLAQELSRGMRQKVAIACALLHQPSLLMLDEPMTGLDPRGIRTMKMMLKEESERGAGVIVSSHLLPLVEDLCTHLLVMHQGACHYFGSVDDARQTLSGESSSASLEEIFFRITEGAESGAANSEEDQAVAAERDDA